MFVLKMEPFLAKEMGSGDFTTKLIICLFFVIFAGFYAYLQNTGIKEIKKQKPNSPS